MTPDNVGSVSQMERIIQVLNEMKSRGIVLDYAIGGAVAATFYVEPIDTADLDVFVALPDTGSPIVTLTAVEEYLSQQGHHFVGEHVSIFGVPVQFLGTNELT